MRYQFPPFLQPSDTIGITAPSGYYPLEDRRQVEQLFARYGWRVEWARHLTARYGTFSGTDSQRLTDLQYFLDAPHIRAIIMLRGGYGATRIVDGLSPEGFRRSPKWIVGFSDITTLLGWAAVHGVASLHAPVISQFFKEEYKPDVEALLNVLAGILPDPLRLPPHPEQQEGRATAPLVGGNLSLLVSQIGTRSMPPTEGHLLFLEDVNEPAYRIDRMMVQLDRAGILAGLAGLMIGHFSGVITEFPYPFPFSVEEIVEEKVAKYSYPVCYGFPAGHRAPNHPLMIGAVATLEVTPQGSTFYYPSGEGVSAGGVASPM